MISVVIQYDDNDICRMYIRMYCTKYTHTHKKIMFILLLPSWRYYIYEMMNPYVSYISISLLIRLQKESFPSSETEMDGQQLHWNITIVSNKRYEMNQLYWNYNQYEIDSLFSL